MSRGLFSGQGAGSRLVLGLAIITFGLLMTAANLGWVNRYAADQFWPLLFAFMFIVAGVSRFNRNVCASSVLFGLALTGLGVWIAKEVLFPEAPFHLERWWPLLIILAGVAMLARSGPQLADAAFPVMNAEGTITGAGAPGGTGASGISGDDDTIHAFAFWSGARRRVTSQMFRGGDAVAVMGGVEIDLRQAAGAAGDAVLDVFAMWGGVHIRVSPDWVVVDQAFAFMGGTDNRTQSSPSAKYRLIVRGVAIMGGISIK